MREQARGKGYSPPVNVVAVSGSGEGEDGIGEGYLSTENAGCNHVKRSGI